MKDTNDSSPEDLLEPALTVPEVAKILRISRVHAYRLASRGVIPSYRVGRRRRLVSPKALREWIDAGGSASEGGAAVT